MLLGLWGWAAVVVVVGVGKSRESSCFRYLLSEEVDFKIRTYIKSAEFYYISLFLCLLLERNFEVFDIISEKPQLAGKRDDIS